MAGRRHGEAMTYARPIRDPRTSHAHDRTHGTAPGVVPFSRGCRCSDCTFAAARAKRWVDMRVQGLSTRAIAERDGVSAQTVVRDSHAIAPDRPWDDACPPDPAPFPETVQAIVDGHRECAMCGTSFVPGNPNTLVCSQRCTVMFRTLGRFLTGERRSTRPGSRVHMAALAARMEGWPVFERLPLPVRDLVVRSLDD